MKQRKIPLRKCTGCQEMKNKKELIRIVRNDAGEISLDFTGKKTRQRSIYLSVARVFRKGKKIQRFGAFLQICCTGASL